MSSTDASGTGRASGAPPEVSFLIAARNAAPYVAGAICSALAQRDCSVEVVVVDDASSDATPAIVKSLAARDPRVRLVLNGKQAGVSAARNRAMALARGRWLAVLDADDEVVPDRARSLIAAAEMISADLVADNMEHFGPAVRRRTTTLSLGPSPYNFVLDPAGYIGRNHLLRGGGVNLGYLKPIFRRAFLEAYGLRYDERLRVGEDFHLALSALLRGAKFLCLSEATYRYRVADGSLSWRLTGADFDAMGAAFRGLAPRIAAAGSPEIDAAAQGYLQSLARARAIHDVIEDAKRGRLSDAVSACCAVPRAWGFLARVGARRAGRSAMARLKGAA